MEARRLLGWTVSRLAYASGTYGAVIATFEKFDRIIVARSGSHLMAIRAALEAGGVEFRQEDESGLGVRLKQ